MLEENTEDALNDIQLVDKAVSYILGQPDGILRRNFQTTRSMLIHLQLIELRFEIGGRSGWIVEARSAGKSCYTVYRCCTMLGTGRMMYWHIHKFSDTQIRSYSFKTIM